MQHVETALDRKEALVLKLRRLGSAVESGSHLDREGRPLPAFEQDYTQSVAELKEVSWLAFEQKHTQSMAELREVSCAAVSWSK